MNKKSAPGVDAVCYGTFEANLEENIKRIVEDLKGNRYKAKLQIALANIRKWIRVERNKYGTAVIMKKLRLKLLGHWNYYGVFGNIEMLKVYYSKVCRIMFKWLNRRSQRKSYNWYGFKDAEAFSDTRASNRWVLGLIYVLVRSE